MFMMRIMLATVYCRFRSWGLVIKLNFCSDFELWSGFWSWSLVLPLMFCRGRTHICHVYHGLFPWRKICHMEKFQISVMNLNNLWSFIEIFAVFVLNLCGEKSVEKKWQKWGLSGRCTNSSHHRRFQFSGSQWKAYFFPWLLKNRLYLVWI